MVDFEHDLRETAIAFLDQYDVKYKQKDDLMQLLIKLNTFFEKYIVPQKRSVSYSKELSCKMGGLPKKTQVALSKLDAWIQAGIDINCFQGRGLYGGGSRDYQNALYGVVHLHLSAGENDVRPVTKGRFAKPGQYLLFALFQENASFFLDVVPHPEALNKDNPSATEWTSTSLVKIIENNWPELLKKSRIPITCLCDGNGNAIDLDDQEIAELTVHHINTFVAGNQGFYMLRPGISSSGDNTSAVMSAQKVIRYVTQCELCYKENEEEIHANFARILSENGFAVPTEFDIHFDYVLALDSMVVLDRNSGAAIDLSKQKLYILPNT